MLKLRQCEIDLLCHLKSLEVSSDGKICNFFSGQTVRCFDFKYKYVFNLLNSLIDKVRSLFFTTWPAIC